VSKSCADGTLRCLLLGRPVALSDHRGSVPICPEQQCLQTHFPVVHVSTQLMGASFRTATASKLGRVLPLNVQQNHYMNQIHSSVLMTNAPRTRQVERRGVNIRLEKERFGIGSTDIGHVTRRFGCCGKSREKNGLVRVFSDLRARGTPDDE
jgi:hypothetical protein